jgi:glycosidase
VRPDLELREVYRTLIALRKAHLELFVDGAVRELLADDAREILAYERVLGDGPDAQRAVMVFNLSHQSVEVAVEVPAGRYRVAFLTGAGRPGGTEDTGAAGLTVELPPHAAGIWIRGEG